MSRAARAVLAALAFALLAAALPAAAWHRTEGDPGRCLWWRARQIPYVLNASAANPAGCRTQANAVALARESLATWSAATLSAAPAGSASCTDVALTGGDEVNIQVAGYVEGGANQNLVVWRSGTCASRVPVGDPCLSQGPGACADQYNCWDYDTRGTIALTTTTYRPSSGEIVDADMELFDRPGPGGAGFYFTCPGPGSPQCGAGVPTGSCISMDLGSIVTHEGGHMLGIAHNCESSINCPDTLATMFVTNAQGDTSRRTLRDDDVDAVCKLYPRAASVDVAAGTGQSGAQCLSLSQVPAPASPSSSGGCGCASAGPADAAALLALAALARRRLRRR